MKKIVVFASGSGSNFQAIVEQLHLKRCEVALLVCDTEGAYYLERAKHFKIPTFLVNPKDYESKMEFEKVICERLTQIEPDLIVLAGYMRIIGETLLDAYEGKIVNIHPALLPAFPGRDGITDALNYGVKVMGVTVHYVNAGIDTGKIIDQLIFKRSDEETKEEIIDRIHALEHELYPKVITRLLKV